MTMFSNLQSTKLLKSYFNLLLVCLLLSPNLFSQKKILILGSSTSACTGPSVIDSCYVTRLQKYYLSKGINVTIDNRAVGGYTVYAGMPTGYIPPAGRSNPEVNNNITAGLAGKPDVVMVNYPSNGYDNYSLKEILYCLRTIKETANKAGVPCYITSTQPRQEGASFRTPEVKRKMFDIKDSVLFEFGHFGINFFDGLVNNSDTTILPQYNSGDGVHLNNAAHGILFDRVKQADILSSNLPLSLDPIKFYASINNGNVLINLKLGNVDDINLFKIEKSANGINFVEAIKDSPGVLATTSSVFNFSSVDSHPFNGVSFYRAQVLYKNGDVKYSQVVEVKIGKNNVSISVYPNPVFNHFSIKSNNLSRGNYSVGIYDQSGQEVFKEFFSQKEVEGNTSVNFNKTLPSGIYYVVLRGENGVIKTINFLKNY